MLAASGVVLLTSLSFSSIASKFPPPSCPSADPPPPPPPPPPVGPWPGNTYLILDRESERVITLMEGDISLQVAASGGAKVGGQQWECVETNGWIGFRNPVSG